MLSGRFCVFLLLTLPFGVVEALCAQIELPDAPMPEALIEAQVASGSQSSSPGQTAANHGDTTASEPLPAEPAACQSNVSVSGSPKMTCAPTVNPFQRFLNSSTPHPLTPRQKLYLAGKNVIDPFNLLTIVGSSAITVASNPDSAYGPGMHGFAKYTGVSFTQDLTGEFFGTFLIPSIAHQDPHFHRMPNASIQRRVAHAIYQVVWTQSDAGTPMFNYATVVGTLLDEGVSDLYVPNRKTGLSPDLARVGTSIATAPIGNLVTEFLPDLARRFNVHVVLVQRIIDRVATGTSEQN
jgi:hypothetical protein